MAKYYYEKYSINYYWDKISSNAIDSETIVDSNVTTESRDIDGEQWGWDDDEGAYLGFVTQVEENIHGYDSYGLELSDYTEFPIPSDSNVFKYADFPDYGEPNLKVYEGYITYTDDYGRVYWNITKIHELNDTYKIYKHREKGSYIETIVAEDGTYPDDGFQGGYYWVKTTKPEVSLNSIGDKSLDVLQTLDFYVSASIDGDINISYSIEDKPDGASFNTSNGHFAWTPEEDQGGTYYVTFTASANGSTDSETITITVYSPYPNIESISDKNVDENKTISFDVNTNDPDNDTINCYIKSGKPSGASFSFSGTSGTFEWTPDYTQSGEYTITFEAEANGYYDTETVKIVVNDILPQLDPIGDKTVDENKNLNFTVTASISDDSTITLSATGVPSGASFDTSTGEFDWTPTFYQSGSYDITFEAEANGDVDSETITITVNEIHKAPGSLSPVQNYETENRQPTFEMTLPANDETDNLLYHARLRVADNSAMREPDFLLESRVDQSNWEYYDGTNWQPMPSEGVPADTKVRVTLPRKMGFSFFYWDTASWEISYGYGLNSAVRKINILISTEKPYVLAVEATTYDCYSLTATETSNGEIGSIDFTVNNEGGVADDNINYGDTVVLAVNDELGNQEQFRGIVRQKQPSGSTLQVKAPTGDGILSERIVKENYSAQDIGLTAKQIIDDYCDPLTSENINTSTGIIAPVKANGKKPLKIFEELRRQHGIYYFVDADWDMNFYLRSEIDSYKVEIRRGD